MSATGTAASPPALQTAAPAGLRGFGRLTLAEWTKIRTVRSTAWTLVLFVVITIGLTALFSWLTVSNWTTGARAGERDARILADPVAFIFGAGISLGQLTICVLGVLLITAEFSTGVIKASLLAVPKRFPMLAAKIVVFAVLVLILAEIVAFGSFFLGSAILHSRVAVRLSDPGVLRATVGTGLYLTVLGIFALAIGCLIRHTAAAISTVIGVVLVLPILTGLLPSSWGDHVNAYSPEPAGTQIYEAHPGVGDLLTPWEGFGVFCIWAALLLAAAAYTLQRRDA
jgi:ABC-2 type transport system permease protein